MSGSIKQSSTDLKRKHEEEETGCMEEEADQATELVSPETSKKVKFQDDEKTLLNIEIDKTEAKELNCKLKANDGITEQELKSKENNTSLEVEDDDDNMLTSKQVPTESATNVETTKNNKEVNERETVEVNLLIENVATTANASEICSKEQDEHDMALTETSETAEHTVETAKSVQETVQCQTKPITEIVSTALENEPTTKNDGCMENTQFNIISEKANELVRNYIEKNVLTQSNFTCSPPDTNCYPPTQKIYKVLKEPKDSKPLGEILRPEEAKKLMAQIKPTRILFPSSLSVTVKQFSDKDGIKKAAIPKKNIQPSVTIVPIEKNTIDMEDNLEKDGCGENEIYSAPSAEASIASTTNHSTNTISTRKVPNQAGSTIYPIGLITKRMVVENNSDGTSAIIDKATIRPQQQFIPTPTSTTKRKIIAINKNKLRPINYKFRNCVFLSPSLGKQNSTAINTNNKPIITSVEYIPKNPLFVKSINSKPLNDEQANDDFGRKDLTITTASNNTGNSNELPTTTKPKKSKLCDLTAIPTLTPAYLKSLSAYIQEAKKAHKAATIDLRDSSAAEDSVTENESLETNYLVTKKSISKESSELALENMKDESSKTNADADEQLDAKESPQTDSGKSNSNADEQLVASSNTSEEEVHRDSLKNDDDECKTVEIKKNKLSQPHMTNLEEVEADEDREAERRKTDTYQNELEECEGRGETQQGDSVEGNVTQDAAGENDKTDVPENNDTSVADISEPPLIQNNSAREANKSPEIASSEGIITLKLVTESESPQIETDTSEKNHNEQCEVVEGEKMDLIDSDEGHLKGVDVDHDNATQLDIDESEKMDVDESISSTSELKLVAEIGTDQIEIEVEKKEMDSIENDGDQRKVVEEEKQTVYQSEANQCDIDERRKIEVEESSGTNKEELILLPESDSPLEPEECKVVTEEKKDLTDYDEEHSEGVVIEKQTMEQNEATQCDINKREKMEADKSCDMQAEVDNIKDLSVVNSSNSNEGNDDSIVLSENKSTNDSCIGTTSEEKEIMLDTESKAPECEVNDEQKNHINESKLIQTAVDERDKIKVVKSNTAHSEICEQENKSIPVSYATQCEDENDKKRLSENKNAEGAKETDDTQTIPVLNKSFNNAFSSCIKSNKCNAFTQTNDSTIRLLENISALRKKVRKQAEEIVSLNAAMKLLDTASLLKTFDNC